jgi:hypothetical protein
MWPSNEAVASRSGFRGHHVVWKDQSDVLGSWRSAVPVPRAHLSDDLAGLRVPAQCPVVLAAGKKEVGVLTTPRHGQYTFVVSAQDLMSVMPRLVTHPFRRPSVSQIPKHDDGRFIVFRGGDQPRRLPVSRAFSI